MTSARPAMTAPRPCAAALLLGAALLPTAVLAQDDDSLAPQGRVTVTQQIAVDDGDLIGVTPVDILLQTGNRSQSLGFSASLPFHEADPDDDGFFGLGDTQAQLQYRRFVRNASIELQSRYLETDLDRLVLFDDITNDIVTLDGGRRADAFVQGGYAFGSQSNFGGEFSASYLDRRYTDTSDPDLFDTNTKQIDATVFLEPTPLIRARILGSLLRTDSDGGTDTRRDRYGIGGSFQAGRQVNLDLELAQSRNREDDQQDGITEESDGLSVRSSVTYLRPDGDLTFGLSSDPSTDGRRDRVNIGRSFDRRGYNFAVMAGATRLDEGSLDPIFQVTYDTDPDSTSQIRFDLQRQAISDVDGDQAINTSLRGSYSRQVRKSSSVGISLFYRESKVQTGDSEDARSAALDINYNQSIGRDLSLTAGVNVIRSSSDDNTLDNDDDNESRIYLGLGRSFNFLR